MAAINYQNIAWRRPYGASLLVSGLTAPLVLRNPQSTVAAYDRIKCGPSVMLRYSASDYECFYEGVANNYGALTNFIMRATATRGYDWSKDTVNNPIVQPNGTTDWENGEICFDTILWDPVRSVFLGYYHGGNNSGNRAIGIMTAPKVNGKPGAWTRYSGNPIVTVGSGWEALHVADAKVFRLSATDWRMLYRGDTAANIPQFGYATASNPFGPWTKYVGNPVLPLGSGNDVNHVEGLCAYVDSEGRVHAWYVGFDASNVARVLYAYSDNWTAWTRNQAQVILADSATATDPDAEGIGDVLTMVEDDGLLQFHTMGFNFASYNGDAIGRLEGRCQFWLPKQENTTPTRPGRVYGPGTTTQQRSPLNVASSPRNSTSFSIWTDFRAMPGDTYRELYTDYAAFNNEVFLRLTNAGRIEAEFRTPTAQVIISSPAGTRYDDNQWHRCELRRTATNAFALYVDGVQRATSATNPSTSATASLGTAIGNWYSGTIADEPSLAIQRQVVVLLGRALSDSEELTLWNSGNDGGTLPGGVTATVWVKLGSGGVGNADAAYSGATYGASAPVGSFIVNGAVTTLDLSAVSGARRGRSRPRIRV